MLMSQNWWISWNMFMLNISKLVDIQEYVNVKWYCWFYIIIIVNADDHFYIYLLYLLQYNLLCCITNSQGSPQCIPAFFILFRYWMG